MAKRSKYIPTPRQMQILQHIAHGILVKGCAPTLREIAEKMQVTHKHIQADGYGALERKGCIRRGKRYTHKTTTLTDWGRYQLGIMIEPQRGTV